MFFEHTLRKPAVRDRWAHGTGRNVWTALRARLGVPVERLVDGFDVLHLTDYATLRSRQPIVSMIHDVSFETHPDCYPVAMRERLAAVTRRLIQRSAHVVVPAARVRRNLIERFAADPQRVHVTPLGHRDLPSPPTARSGRPYVLCVGTLMPRKNHARLVAAFQALPVLDDAPRLLLAGARGFGDEDLVEAIARSPDVEHVIAPDDATLAGLYAGARVVVEPSLDEGFGLPVVEALAMGKPVLVGEDTTCADVAGDAALAVDVTDVDALRDGLLRLLTEDALRHELVGRGPRRAAQFTWDGTARATRPVYEQALA